MLPLIRQVLQHFILKTEEKSFPVVSYIKKQKLYEMNLPLNC